MRCSNVLILLALLVAAASCGRRESDALSGTGPRRGGTEVDPPKGGFHAVAGQTLYVPAYSTILSSDKPNAFNLAVTLSIRNVDPKHPILLESVRYYDHDGKLLRDYVRKPVRLEPMAAVEYFVRERDTSGGISAGFVVDWFSETPAAAPVVESVMIGISSSQGISFTSPGRVVVDRTAPAAAPAERH